MRKNTRLSAILAASLVVSGVGLLGTDASAATVIKVSLTDTSAAIDPTVKLAMGMGGDMSKATMLITADQKTVPAGEVTFQVSNDSKQLVHEMIVSAIGDTTKPLPYLENENRADEDNAGDLGEVSELDPGKGGSLTITLKPGTYLLYCNVPGHYMSGMWTTITAK